MQYTYSMFKLTEKGEDFLKTVKERGTGGPMPAVMEILDSIQTRSDLPIAESDYELVDALYQNTVIERVKD